MRSDRNLATAIGRRYSEAAAILRTAHRLDESRVQCRSGFGGRGGVGKVVVVPEVEGQERGGAQVSDRELAGVVSFDPRSITTHL